mmetsp:Transcript_23391/g.44388  ORF Transcript_23391/g.44388 Transcript_23391/m.44388 type:complete len:109 (-) Transcript_23391:1315-1641(-)
MKCTKTLGNEKEMHLNSKNGQGTSTMAQGLDRPGCALEEHPVRRIVSVDVRYPRLAQHAAYCGQGERIVTHVNAHAGTIDETRKKKDALFVIVVDDVLLLFRCTNAWR